MGLKPLKKNDPFSDLTSVRVSVVRPLSGIAQDIEAERIKIP
jgi:hypothetical protein